MREYYERRAPEYDEWYPGTGLFAARDRPGWKEELRRLTEVVASLSAGRTLDVACGTGFLTRHLCGDVVALDQSAAMLEQARSRVPTAAFLRGDASALPVRTTASTASSPRTSTATSSPPDRRAFLCEARRVARELVVVDSSRVGSDADEAWQERVLNDGSRWQVFKRWFTPDGLARELGGGETLFAGRWFVAVRSP